MQLLTIGIPTFNRAAELEAQIESLAPHVGEWCWLVGDDEKVAWRYLGQLTDMLRTEKASAVHLVHPRVTWPEGADELRWLPLQSHVGAWKTARAAFGRAKRRKVDEEEARRRARDVVRAGVRDLLGIGRAELDLRTFGSLWSLFPIGYWPLLLRLVVARAAWLSPRLGAALARVLARKATRGWTAVELERSIRERARAAAAGSEY